jgi:hypothetical protein
MIGSYAFAAQNAFAQIPDDKWIGLLQRFEVGHMIEICFSHAQLRSNLPELAAVALVADNAGFRMLRDHQTGDIASVFDNPWAGCLNHQIRCNGSHAGCHQATGFFIFNQAHAAGTVGFKLRMVA